MYLNEHLKGEHTSEHIVKVPQDLQAQKRDTMLAINYKINDEPIWQEEYK